MAGPLKGVRVLDLSRILAGPWSTQVLADFGAEVIKVERPKVGDDTRHWGPPYLTDKNGMPTDDAAYFLAANRGKKSLTLDFTKPEGKAVIERLVKSCDVFVENYKVDGLKKYGLDYQAIKEINPKIIYSSITGFGQTGPYADLPGYDAIIQGMGGLMSVTGEPEESGGRPQKVGVAVADLMTGMYSVSAVIAALYHREKTGKGQHIDIALLDTQVAWLANQNMNYLVSGENPKRHGTAHPNIVPYQAVKSADGYFMLAVGNDKQFESFCLAVGKRNMSTDPRFLTNQQRVLNRDVLIPLIENELTQKNSKYWLERLNEFKVPSAPINTLSEVFEDPQIKYRKMQFEMKHSIAGSVQQVANPINFSESYIEYDKAPPSLGEHNLEVLESIGLNKLQIGALIEKGII